MSSVALERSERRVSMAAALSEAVFLTVSSSLVSLSIRVRFSLSDEPGFRLLMRPSRYSFWDFSWASRADFCASSLACVSAMVH